MKQKLIYWLLNNPCSAYERIRQRTFSGQHIKVWDRVRVRLARQLMGD